MSHLGVSSSVCYIPDRLLPSIPLSGRLLMINFTMPYRCTVFVLLSLFALTFASGCRFPLFGKPSGEQAATADIATQYGPTPAEQIDKIDQLGRAAAPQMSSAPPTATSVAERQRIAHLLAQQIRVESDPLIRAKIIAAITKTRTPLAAEVLRAGLNDEDLDVQIAACDSWGSWGGRDAVSALADVLEDESADLDVQLAATKSLANVQDAGAALALGVALEDRQDPALQYRAAQSLRSITGLDHGNNLVAWRDYVTSLSRPLANPSETYVASPNKAATPSGDRQFWR